MEVQKASRRKIIWYWLTCWRPITKYEHVQLWKFLMKFGTAVQNDHIKFNKDIVMLKKHVGIKETKKENENLERGMYT